MPDSPDADLDEIRQQAEEIVSKHNGKISQVDKEPIAFGLVALVIGFSIPESQELEPLEEALGQITNVNSVQVVDMRRAFG